MVSKKTETKNKKLDPKKILNYSVIVILSLSTIVIFSIIKDYVVPIVILNTYQITSTNIKLVLSFVLLTTYISLVHFPIKNLINKNLK